MISKDLLPGVLSAVRSAHWLFFSMQGIIVKTEPAIARHFADVNLSPTLWAPLVPCVQDERRHMLRRCLLATLLLRLSNRGEFVVLLLFCALRMDAPS